MGASFTWWHKHSTEQDCLEADNIDCAVQVLAAYGQEGLCWAFRLLASERVLFFENSKGVEHKHRYADEFALPQQTLNAATTPVWRHIAITLNDSDDSVSFYLDGRLGWQGPWGSSVRSADCKSPSRVITLGRRRPQWSKGLPIAIYDMRMYTGHVLAAPAVWRLSQVEDEVVIGSQKCTDTTLAMGHYDKRWEDAHNRGCDWFEMNRKDVPIICTLEEPQKFCPIAVSVCVCVCVCVLMNAKSLCYSWDIPSI